jgi:hypothetical protein
LEYATAACQHVTFEPSEIDEFDKDTAEAWLDVDKKERKNLAKTMHPTEALARKRKKQAEDDAKDPVDAALKRLKAIKLGTRPRGGKPLRIQTEKFEEVKRILENVINDASAPESLKTMASETTALIREDKDSHALHEELMKRLEEFKKAQLPALNDESPITTEEEAAE